MNNDHACSNSAARPLTFDPQKCNGCNRCIEACQVDIMVPGQEERSPPILQFPGECWYCGCCVAICPRPGAIHLNPLSMNRVHWKRKSTGEDFWL